MNSKTPHLIKQLEDIRSGINSKKTNYKLPLGHEYKITPYWLLGFIEAKVHFILNHGPSGPELSLIFNISQSLIDLELLKAIQKFLLRLAGESSNPPK